MRINRHDQIKRVKEEKKEFVLSYPVLKSSITCIRAHMAENNQTLNHNYHQESKPLGHMIHTASSKKKKSVRTNERSVLKIFC